MKRSLRISGTPSVPIREHGGGFVAEGPGFYIWDEDPCEPLRVARDLEQGDFDIGRRRACWSSAMTSSEVRPPSR
jgi:hypothetical protein